MTDLTTRIEAAQADEARASLRSEIIRVNGKPMLAHRIVASAALKAKGL